MKQNLEKTYDPKHFEKKLYSFWQEKGYFKPKIEAEKEPYTIVIPPPNITGQLHMGHALDETYQDIFIRWRRMQGYAALWIPGTDHASIATEAKITEALRAEGINKKEIGREAFLQRAWKWKENYGGRIIEQLKSLGASCDWSRERFTLDDGCSKAVQKFFVDLYEKGLIYRGERMVHWCSSCKTSLSDAEVTYEQQPGYLWHLRYPLSDGSGEIVLATTRPETLLGDTAVAVHPKDQRYQHLIGKTVILPLTDRVIPIVGDEYVDQEFGTGAVKITPAHDPNDFAVGKRHHLPIITVLTEEGNIESTFGKYAGLSRGAARKSIVKDLKEGGFLVKEEAYTHNVGHCYRCGDTIEPRLSKQWFVKMESLAKPAIEAVKNGEIEFIPSHFSKIYFHWMENIKDWCISRQLWWGHRIPAYYCDTCHEIIVSSASPKHCPHCGGSSFHQEEDTLDTWFSAALWPFSTLGWPDQTEDLDYFYPTSILVTAYDIIFFWVARMIFSALSQTGKVPFKKVLIHGLVRDAQGRKMSKSLGNGIDPLEIIDLYGADALRFMLASGTNTGNDLRFSEEKIKSARNFANKLWNAARFILMNLDTEIPEGLPKNLALEDYWVLSHLNETIKEVTQNLEKFEISVASQKIYDFIWNVFCDWYIEICKTRLQGNERSDVQRVLCYAIRALLQLLHPFMPFITEEIWQNIPHTEESIMISKWPEFHQEMAYRKERETFEKIMDVIKRVRNIRSQMQVEQRRKIRLYIQTETPEIFVQGASFIQRLAGVEKVILTPYTGENAIKEATDTARLFIPMDDLLDKEKELLRLGKEKKKCEEEISFLNKKLKNPNFVHKAPTNVVENEKLKLEKAQNRLIKIEKNLDQWERGKFNESDGK